jgi:MerR family transcriptional regulator, mercuric resistance operon regulatory protein
MRGITTSRADGLTIGASCRQVREIAAHHLDDIRTKIADLRKLERLLAKTIAQCTGTTAPVCPVLDILDIQRSA